MALGAFAPVDIAARNARMIIRSPAPTPVAPPPRVSMPVSRIPIIPKTVPPPNVDPIVKGGTIITETTTAMGGGTAPAPSAPTGPTTAPQTGSTGTDNFSRLIDLIGSQYAAQDVSGNLAPVSFASESTDGGAAASGGSSPMVPIILAVVVIGGVWLYMKHKGK